MDQIAKSAELTERKAGKADLPKAIKIATSHILIKFTTDAFALGFQQALEAKKRLNQEALFAALDFVGLRNYHKKVVWEAYKSGRFEAVASLKLDVKY